MINDKARALTEQIESSVNALAAETDEVRKGETGVVPKFETRD